MINNLTTALDTAQPLPPLEKIIEEIQKIKAQPRPAVELKVGSAALETLKKSPQLTNKDVSTINMIWGIPVVESAILPPKGYVLLDDRGGVLCMGFIE